MKLIQEVPTRFGTTFDVVQIFLKSESNFHVIAYIKTGDAGDKSDNVFPNSIKISNRAATSLILH